MSIINKDAGSPESVCSAIVRSRNSSNPFPIRELREWIDHTLAARFLELRTECANAIRQRDELSSLILTLLVEQ